MRGLTTGAITMAACLGAKGSPHDRNVEMGAGAINHASEDGLHLRPDSELEIAAILDWQTEQLSPSPARSFLAREFVGWALCFAAIGQQAVAASLCVSLSDDGGVDLPAAVIWNFYAAKQRYLPAAGLSDAHIDAIAMVGLGTDELHELLLRGINQVAGGTSK